MSEETNHSDGDKPAVPSNPLLGTDEMCMKGRKHGTATDS